MHRYVIVLFAALICSATFAQHRTLIGFELGAYLRTADPATPVDLFLQGNSARVAAIAKAHGGQVKMSMRNWVSVRMPAGRIAELNSEREVRSIDFRLGRGRVMNDSMRVKTGIDRIQAGEAPLPQGYEGDDVVMGIVDTGLDFHHPDFQDSLGGTRVLRYWAHPYPVNANTPQPFGYGQAWDKATIDAGNCPANDLDAGGHGTTVTGTAAGNGGQTGEHIGAAPNADLVVVATNLNAPNWPATVADGVKFVFDEATTLGKPAVVNLSLGDYLGSHDGLDPAALFIDSMLMAAPGRAVVCAAGNSGCFPNYTLRMNVDSDTSFSWFKTNSANFFTSTPGAYIDFWGDAASMNDIQYSIGADRVAGGYTYRGRIPFRNAQSTIDTYGVDTLYSISGNRLAVCTTFTTVRGGQYHLEILLQSPDSAAYYWRVMMTGNGLCDAWDNNGFGLSEIVSGMSTPPPPTAAVYPPMANYVLPTLDRGIVDSWACSPHVICVANYQNETDYIACNGNPYSVGGTEGSIAFCSSYGNTRTGLQKPDLAAPGDITFSAAPMALLALFQGGSGIFKLSSDCMHVRAGGTSIASPAVAGTAALYLQKCPDATHMEIMDAINNTAFADAFTGAVPNLRFGRGKLNSFVAMLPVDYDVAISGEPQVCDGDSVLVEGPAGFQNYVWSDGTTDPNAWSQGEDLSVTVFNSIGCSSGNDTISFTVLPLPTTPVITPNGTALQSTPADTYQWALNGNDILDAEGQTWTPVTNGDYTVTITAPNGCTSTSLPYALLNVGVTDSPAQSELAIWPSPVHDVLHVQVDQAGQWTWAMVDATGRVVQQGSLQGDAVQELDVSALTPGHYSLRITQPGTRYQRPFVVR
jgi:hypothetical protein